MPITRHAFFTLLVLLGLILGTGASATSLPGLTSDPGASESTESESLPEPIVEPVTEPTESASRAIPSPLQQFSFWVMAHQRSLHRALSASMENLDRESSLLQFWSLIMLSFLYGVFHAAGPGHGKAVITTYMLTQPTDLKRGLLLSLAAALMQGITAIVLVLVVVFGLGMLAREAVSSVQVIERVSFALIAGLGLVLLWRAGSPLWSTYQQHRANRSSAAPVKPGSALTLQFSIPEGQAAQTPATGILAAHAHAPGESCPTCGKQHHIAPDQLAGNSAFQNLGLVMSIGARPCTGAVLILVVANLLGLWWAGVLGVIAMSLGTALTVSILATLAVTARATATRFLGLNDRLLSGLGLGLAGVGGVILLLLGSSLLLASLTSQQPFGLL
ncbi:MAG: nickel/cobalt transporter [Natronospirillum sp.]|uniref:nickel/cobalt transporter n=1 Tax=Natronospirillum sp. TaxID=2812955 RepID=UPI0025F0EDD5|nr:nickel/cobalt transporter [Natronospirillum sp.]MCH8551240.1 nickel/cobalt transporter [Natronospirillum sp.]